MVEVREHRLAGALTLGENGIDVVLHDFEDAGAAARFDEVTKIGGVDVDGRFFVVRGNLFARNEEEFIALLEHFLELWERGEADLDVGAIGANVDLVREGGAVFIEREQAGFVGADVNPLLAFEEDVVIGDGEEMVAVGFIPGGDHFGEVVAVAPEAVGVEVAFPPVAGLGGGGNDSEEQKAEGEEVIKHRWKDFKESGLSEQGCLPRWERKIFNRSFHELRSPP